MSVREVEDLKYAARNFRGGQFTCRKCKWSFWIFCKANCPTQHCPDCGGQYSLYRSQ